MSYTLIIPARYASTRLPGKPLLDIGGKPMIQRVYEQAQRSGADKVVIATDDARIMAAAEGFGADACMTSADHVSGTDRLQEVATKLGLGDEDIVVNVQGDEPLIPPANIHQVAQLLIDSPNASIATLAEPIGSVDELFDPNAVKVVANVTGEALYFSRAPIPWARDDFADTSKRPAELPASSTFLRHIGIYAYRVGLLHRFVGWPPAPIEETECLEQLRAMWNGERIQVAVAEETPPPGVDTQADLDRVRAILAQVEG